MTKRERMLNLLAGKPVDRTPTGFWLHFPPECGHGEAAVRAHADFMKATDTDILKIMNENLLYGGSPIDRLQDLGKYRRFTRKDPLFQDQMEIIRRVVDAGRGEALSLATVHGLIASAFHATGYEGYYSQKGYALTLFCRERPQQMKDAFKMVAESLAELVDCSLEAGADGIFYAALGGERHLFTDEEFAEFVAPVEKELYGYIQSRTAFNVLHICKGNIALERYQDYRPKIVNWAVYENGVSLREGAERYFPGSILLGGYDDRSGVLVDGTEEQIAARCRELLQETEGLPFILGADCTLPTLSLIHI